jgi:PAS domain S-box-containing protein
MSDIHLMNKFNQFDISSFFDELRDPLFLIDSEEIIYKNKYFNNNFEDIPDSWASTFSNPKLLREIFVFFEKGIAPYLTAVKGIKDKLGENHQYDWSFTNLPSSFQRRFLIVTGRKVKFFSESQNEDHLTDSEINLEDKLRYMQSILNNSHDMISILDEHGNYKFISSSATEKLGFPVGAIIGQNFKDFIQRGVIEIVKGDYDAIFKSKKEINLDFWVNKIDGSRIYLEGYAKNLFKILRFKELCLALEISLNMC